MLHELLGGGYIMSVKQRNNKWQAYVTLKGQRHRRSFTSHTEATLWEAQVRSALENGTPLPPKASSTQSQCLTLGSTVTAVDSVYWRGSKSEDNVRHTCNAILRYFGSSALMRDINSELIISYVNNMKNNGRMNSTINRHLAVISKLLKHSLTLKVINALPEMPTLKEDSHRLRWFTKQEEEAILATMKLRGLNELADMVIVSIDTGMRASELLKFDPVLYPIGDDGLGLYIPDRKNGDSLLLPATRRVQDIVNKGGFKHSVKYYRRSWEKVRSELKLHDSVWHTFRHTCCSRLVQGGMGITKVQQWMGHRNISTTMRYAHLAPTSLLTGINILEA